MHLVAALIPVAVFVVGLMVVLRWNATKHTKRIVAWSLLALSVAMTLTQTLLRH